MTNPIAQDASRARPAARMPWRQVRQWRGAGQRA